MNTPTLAAIGLCLLPRLCALTITQTLDLDVVGSPNQFSRTSGVVGTTWGVQQFDPSWGSLQSVSFAGEILASVTIREYNPFINPPNSVTHTPTARLEGSYVAFDLLNPPAPGLPALTQGAPVQLAPGESVITTLDVLNTLSATSFVPGVLSAFIGSDTANVYIRATYSGAQSFGETTLATAHISGTLTYNFSAVQISAIASTPDNGGAAGLLALSAGLMAIVHRRMKRSFPTA